MATPWTRARGARARRTSCGFRPPRSLFRRLSPAPRVRSAPIPFARVPSAPPLEPSEWNDVNYVNILGGGSSSAHVSSRLRWNCGRGNRRTSGTGASPMSFGRRRHPESMSGRRRLGFSGISGSGPGRHRGRGRDVEGPRGRGRGGRRAKPGMSRRPTGPRPRPSVFSGSGRGARSRGVPAIETWSTASSLGRSGEVLMPNFPSPFPTRSRSLPV